MSGEIKITSIEPKHLEATINKLKECGCNIKTSENEIYLRAPKILKSVNIATEPYPGFPTDMQSIFVATLIRAEGISYMTENIFENRYKYVNELIKMGGNIQQQDKRLKITGEKEIKAANLRAKDLRGGAALIIAALQAKGVTEILEVDYILRGYEEIEKKLRKLGAKIYIEEGE